MSKEQILEKIKQASEAYYNTDNPIMSDEEYDNLIEYAELNGWIISDTELNDGAEIFSKEIKHDVPMLSLKKAKSRDELEKYYNYIRNYSNSDFEVSPKLDGLALSLIYNNGILSIASTRGNGEYGENVSHIINHNEIEIDGFVFSHNENLTEIRGELYCTKEDLEYNNNNRREKFKNERIAVVGILKKSKLGLGHKAKLTFRAYSAYNGTSEVQIPNTFPKATDLFPKNKIKTLEQLLETVDEANLWRKRLTTPTDGIVIKPIEILNLKSTDHHPTQFIAYKYPGEIKVTKIIDVNWGIGKTGRITPVAVIKPVTIDGVEINNVTLNNLDWIKEKNIKLNSVVGVTRANDVIPCIKYVLSNENTTEIIPPNNCLICGENTIKSGSYLLCPNQKCPNAIKSKLLYYISRGVLDIEGLNEAVINVLPLSNIVDLVKITKDELVKLKYNNGISLGEKRATLIYENLNKSINTTPEEIWLMTLDFPNVAKNTSKLLLNKFGSIDNLLKSNINELLEIPGIGQTTAEDIVNNFDYAKTIWDELKQLIKLPEKVKTNGETFAITGKVPEGYKNRDEYVKHLENKGYIYHSSIKKDTTYLITDNPDGNSGKLKKAREMGIKLVNIL